MRTQTYKFGTMASVSNAGKKLAFAAILLIIVPSFSFADTLHLQDYRRTLAAGYRASGYVDTDHQPHQWGYTRNFEDASVSWVNQLGLGSYHRTALISPSGAMPSHVLSEMIASWEDTFAGPTGQVSAATVSISDGFYHGIGLRENGTVYAYGFSDRVSDGDWDYGQITVPENLSNVVQIAAGSFHNLALKADGTMVGWGQNDHGQSTIPANPGEVASITAGGWHSLALRTDGTLIGWGHTGNNRLNIPSGITNFVAVEAGHWHTLALRSDGSLMAWGDSGHGKTTIPTEATNIVEIAVKQHHNMALRRDGKLITWGEATHGETVIPQTITNAVGMGFGGWHGYAILEDSSLRGWGNNLDGQSIPPPDPGPFTDVAGGYWHTIALKANGTVVGWGYNGDGAASPPGGLNNVVSIASAAQHSYAVRADGTVVAWGADPWENGVLNIPADVNGQTKEIAAGTGYAIALRTNSSIRAWGNNTAGQTDIPPAASGNNILAVAANWAHSLALRSDGVVIAWGSNYSGQTSVPSGLSSVIDIAAAGEASAALRNDGTVVAWGRDELAAVPSGLSNVVEIAASSSQFYARLESGDIITWGLNEFDAGRLPRTPNPRLPSPPPPKVLTPSQSYTSDTFNIEVRNFIPFPKAEIRYTLDGSTPTTNSPLYEVPIEIDQSLTFKAATFSEGLPHSRIVTQTYERILPVPVFTSSAGSFPDYGVAVTLTTHVAGADIRYTLDGSTPTEDSALYEVSLHLLVPTHVRARLYLPDTTPSPIAEQWFTPAYMLQNSVLDAGQHRGIAIDTNGQPVAWGIDTSAPSVTPADAPIRSIAVTEEVILFISDDGFLHGHGNAAHPLLIDLPDPTRRAVALSASEQHALLLLDNGEVRAWGTNQQGQIDVPPGLEGAYAVAAGADHSLAIQSNRTVIGWGHDASGQTSPPTNVVAVVAIAAGQDHSLALTLDGAIVGWGSDAEGQITPPPELGQVVAIAAGAHHSLALQQDGTVIGWGYNHEGQATPPAGLTNVIAIAAHGHYSLALTASGELIGWGQNTHGQASPPSGTYAIPAWPPRPVAWPQNTYYYETTDIRLFAPMPGATIRYTLNGDDPTAESPAYVGPITITNSVILVARVFHPNYADPGPKVVAQLDRRVLAPEITQPSGTWFDNTLPVDAATGTAGATIRYTLDGTEPTGESPEWTGPLDFEQSALVHYRAFAPGMLPSHTVTALYYQPGRQRFHPVAAGGLHTLYLESDGSAHGFGHDGHQRISAPAAGEPGLVKIDAGHEYSIGLTYDGVIRHWGNETHFGGTVPVHLTNIVDIAAGYQFAVFLDENGQVSAWGRNQNGQTNIPAGLDNVIAIAAGDRHALAVRRDGTIAAWGFNASGQANVPPDLPAAIAVAAGHHHSLALLADGTVHAWGGNNHGNLDLPESLAHVVAIAAGYEHSLALQHDGTVVAWGSDQFGQATPPAGLSNVVAIAASGWHSVALDIEGRLHVWGRNDQGQAEPETHEQDLNIWLPSQPAIPVISPYPDYFIDQIPVQLHAATPDAEIRYTLNGTDPDTDSPLYSDPLLVTETTELRARAWHPQWGAGRVATAVLLERVDQTGIAPDADYFIGSLEVTLYNPTPDAEIRYTLNGDDPDEDSLLYTEPFTITSPTTVRARGMKDGLLPGAVAVHQYEQRTFAPVFNPDSTTFLGTLMVEITSATPGAEIRYTLDGSEPDETGLLYTNTLSFVDTTSIRARAFADGLLPSYENDAQYIVDEAYTPTMHPEGVQHFNHQLQVELTAGTPGAVIRYTLDGSDPDATSPLYEGPITIDRPTYLIARAFLDGYDASLPVSRLFIGGKHHRDRSIAVSDGRTAVIAEGGAEVHLFGRDTITHTVAEEETFASLGLIHHGVATITEPDRRVTTTRLWNEPPARVHFTAAQAGNTFLPVWGLAEDETHFILVHETHNSRLAKDFTGNNQEEYAGSHYFDHVRDAAPFDQGTFLILGPYGPYGLYRARVDGSWKQLLTQVSTNTFGIGYDQSTGLIGLGEYADGEMSFRTYDIDTHTMSDPVTFPFDTGLYGTPTGLDFKVVNGEPRLFVGTRDGPAVDIFSSPRNFVLDMSLAGNIDQHFTTPGGLYKLEDVLVNPNNNTIAIGYSAEGGGGVNVGDFLLLSWPCHADARFLSARSRRVFTSTTNRILNTWGEDGQHRIGQTWVSHYPIQAPTDGLENILDAAAGKDHVAVLDHLGQVQVFGHNGQGQLDIPEHNLPVLHIASGEDHVLAQLADGQIIGWGRNDAGQADPPASVTNVIQLAGGLHHSLALLADGTVTGWGDPAYLEFPVGLTNIVQIAAGPTHSAALRSDGHVILWGDNTYEQLDIPEEFRAHVPGRTALPQIITDAPLDPEGPQWVTLTSPTSGAEFRFTLDGSEPDETSLLYEGPFLLTRNAELRVIAYHPDLQPSLTGTATIQARFDYQDWAAWHELEGEDAEPMADPNQRGFINLLAYALGLSLEPGQPAEHPMLPDGQPIVQIKALPDQHGTFILRFPVRRDAPDLDYQALFADQVEGPWETAPITLVPHDHHWSEATSEDPNPENTPHRFGTFRIQLIYD